MPALAPVLSPPPELLLVLLPVPLLGPLLGVADADGSVTANVALSVIQPPLAQHSFVSPQHHLVDELVPSHGVSRGVKFCRRQSSTVHRAAYSRRRRRPAGSGLSRVFGPFAVDNRRVLAQPVGQTRVGRQPAFGDVAAVRNVAVNRAADVAERRG